jgi:hypothetical protein
MWRLLKDERGNILVFATLAMVSMIGFAALSIDVGTMLSARNQLQAAADAGALSGATGLLSSQAEATTRAITTVSRNNCMRQPVVITTADVTFPQPNRIQVQTHQVVTLNFAGVLGIPSTNVTAVAVAEVGVVNYAKGVKPWAIPDKDYTYGDPVTLKSGVLGAEGTNPGYFYPVDFPPLDIGTPDTGAQEYWDNIIGGSDCFVGPPQELQVEPGNMIGPTNQGVNELISQDPNATWNPSIEGEFGFGDIENSNYPGTSSPRVVIVPMYDPNFVPDSGRNTVTIKRLGVFFVTGFSGRDLTGVFIKTWEQGSVGGGTSMLQGIKLVQ